MYSTAYHDYGLHYLLSSINGVHTFREEFIALYALASILLDDAKLKIIEVDIMDVLRCESKFVEEWVSQIFSKILIIHNSYDHFSLIHMFLKRWVFRIVF
jgi:hypothetical protein